MEKVQFRKNIRRCLFTISLCAPLFWCGTASAIEPSEIQLDKLSFEQIQQAAQAGDPDAQYALGYMYYYGKNTTQNSQEALNWIKRASVQGQEQAVKALALIEGTTSKSATAANASAPASGVQTQAPAQIATNASTPPHMPASPAPMNTAAQANNTPTTSSQPPAQVAANNSATQAYAPASSAPLNTAAQSQAKAASPAAVPNKQNTASTAPLLESVVASTEKPESVVVASTSSKPVSAPSTKPSVAANIKPASGSVTLATQEKHLLGLPSNYHTVQLIGSYSEKDVAKYISANGLQGKATYYRGNNNGKDWYVVLYGIYKTRPQAQAAIATLPESLKKQNPWVRSLDAVQASIKSAPSA